MAHLRGDDRAQIILVAALALAVAFVSMALIVNSAIYTENLASRGETAGSDEALSMRAMVERNVGAGMEAANRHNHSGETELELNLKRSIGNVSTGTELHQSKSGTLVNVTYEDHRMGRRIVQNDSTDFTDGGDTDYALVENVERVTDHNGTRAFRINATDLAETNESAFEVKVNNSGVGNENSWRMRVWNASGDRTIHVRTLRNVSGTDYVEECQVDVAESHAVVDVTSGRVNATPCDALRTGPDGENYRFGSGAGDSYDIYFRNAENVTGNFSMVVHGTGLSFPVVGGLLGSDDVTDALYDATVTFAYETSGMRYETAVRVAPGEPDA